MSAAVKSILIPDGINRLMASTQTCGRVHIYTTTKKIIPKEAVFIVCICRKPYITGHCYQPYICEIFVPFNLVISVCDFEASIKITTSFPS